ncbi:hypothetical protein Dacet_2190 [Denitrovibrio acetiphilus DSM 12809]|uniref:Uncharacterized protein n=1 Tax=Denitrovibrio acetiphilus (strain DSM 12809 / NBRC 114555 / N2460) TaxID=522772 RepID=D4H2G1_DENA2|nr:Ig-like domain-containing protein [Denitrovibrio acetiphilus]ADD68952.1 hypothetical protein Dacet_2190 [Denitrovibrio acetiphilus DSM 12809]
MASFDHVTYTAPSLTTYAAGAEVCSSATAYNSENSTLEGIAVSFSVSGANTASESISTDANGVAEFCYIATNEGTDTITWLDINSNTGSAEVTIGGEPSTDLTVPELLTPDTGDTLTNSNVTFTWDKVEGAEKYIIVVNGHVSIKARTLTSKNFTVSESGVVSWICPVALSDGDYTWTVAAANTEQTTGYAPVSAFSIERPSSVTDLGDGDDIDFASTNTVAQTTLNSIASLNAAYPIHTETNLSVNKPQGTGTATVNTISQINIGAMIASTDVSEIVVNSEVGTITFADADSFPNAQTDEGETVEAGNLGLIIQAYETDTVSAAFDVTMLITSGATAGTIVHTLASPVTFILTDINLIYASGKTQVRLNDTILEEIAQGETSSNADGYWYYDSTEESYHITVNHFSDVSVQNKPSFGGGGGCSAAGSAGADLGMMFIAVFAAYAFYRNRREA